jgi:hypothetical protein
VLETVTVRQFLEEAGVRFALLTEVFSDCDAARIRAAHGSTSRLRHVDIRWAFVQFHVEEGTIVISPIKGAKNPVNGMTKPTAGALFFMERKSLLNL